ARARARDKRAPKEPPRRSVRAAGAEREDALARHVEGSCARDAATSGALHSPRSSGGWVSESVPRRRVAFLFRARRRPDAHDTYRPGRLDARVVEFTLRGRRSGREGAETEDAD